MGQHDSYVAKQRAIQRIEDATKAEAVKATA